ncbi:hypothetical protein ES705_12280 [subsurface metagenome]
MRNSNKKKRIKTCLVLLFYFLSISLFTNFNFEPPFYKDDANKDDFINSPKTSDSLPSFNGVGDKVNVSLHQSYLNNSFNTIVNTSIVNGNNFTLPCPKDVNFNSTFTNITVKDIFAPNKTLFNDWYDASYHLGSAVYASFKVEGTGFLENLSVFLENLVGYQETFSVRLFNATFSITDGVIKYDAFITLLGQFSVNNNDKKWFTLSNLNQILDTSDTYENNFFLQISSGAGASGYWYRSTGGDVNNTIWQGASFSLTRDMSLDFDLTPLNNTPNPEDIGLKINGDKVNGYSNINGTGYWESYIVNGSNSGILKYNVTADWWDVKCNISQVQINYTKTDLRADSSFEVLGNGQDVIWNVTRNGGLNYFGTDFSDYRINFTISATWHDGSIKVVNGSGAEWSTNRRLLGNGYREVEVPNAGNGTYWFLNATSSNLLTNIKKYVGTTSVADTFNYTDFVHFNGTFSSYVSDGSINLSVYNPLALNDQLNYTFVNSSFVSGDDIYFGDWNISDTITKYGNFRILTQWNNGTDAGFFRDDITILAETNLEINQPSQDTTFNSSTIFNVTITYRDREQDLDISDGDIYYKINSGTYSSVNESVTYIGSGKYNITFDCNNTEFNYGSNTITIRANNTYHNNQTETLNIIILGETNLSRPFPKTYNFDSGETFNITLYFNDTVKNLGINESTVDITVNSSAYTPLDFFDYGNGYYNLTVNCSDDVFDIQGYGFFNLSINSEKINYYSQTTSFIIYIKGETNLAATKFPEPIKGYYNSDETFNITVFFNDLARNEGINDGIVNVYVKRVSSSIYQLYDTTIFPYGIGYYNFTVNCSDSEFDNYGKYDIQINVSKQHYYNAIYTFFGELIIGNTTLTIIEPSGMVSHVDDETFDIKIEYINHTKSDRITEADITYTINGTDHRSDNVINNPDGTYNITIDAGDSDFENNYGYRDIIINANKTNYVNLTETFTFERQVSTQINPTNTPALFEVIRGKNITFTFNYSDKFYDPIERYDNFQSISSLNNFEWYLWNDGNGNYTLEVDSTNVIVKDTPYELNFSISAFGNETQKISLTILVTIIQTSIEIESWNNNADFARSTWTNVSINFYFNDTTNIAAIDGLIDNDIKIKDYYAGTTWQPGFELFNQPGPGNYKLNISTIGKNSGLYTLQLNISKYPNYKWSLAYIQFYLRGNYTQINMISVEDLEEILTPSGIGNNYTTFVGSDLTLEFNVTDTEYGDKAITEGIPGYIITITYKNLITELSGTLQQSFSFVFQSADYGTYIGDILTSEFIDAGYYLINITFAKLNYKNTTFSFNLTLVNSQINIISISNQGGQLELSGINNFYNSSVAVDITIEFNITDTESLNRTIARDASLYIVRFTNLDTGKNGILVNTFEFSLSTSTYNGTIITSGLPAGNYLINLSVVILNYKIIPLTFNLTIVLAESNIISITNMGGQLSPTGVGGFYEPTVTTDIDIEFNITDANFGNVIQIGTGISYTISYINIDTLENGILLNTITELALSHFGSIDISSLSIGNYSIAIIINKTNNMVSYFSFNIRIILAESNIISITNPGGQLSPTGVDSFYESFIESNINIGFNITDANFGNIIQIGAGISYTISYINIDTLENGILLHSITELALSHFGSLDISLLSAGNYTFLILVEKNNNDITTLSFNLRLIEKYDVRITILGKPDDVVAGRSFTIIIGVEYFNGSAWLPLVGINVISTLYFDGVLSTETQARITNSTGGVLFEITVRSDAVTMNLTIQLESSYYHIGKSAIISDIIIIPPAIGLTFEDLLPYILIIGAVVAVAGGSIAVYRGVIVPKKRKKQRILTEVKTIFDDAINLEHILVLYKGTGTCIFFKSYGSEQIDPELIGGFLSAVSSFGKEMKTQEALNEISYGDKMLLLADGEYIRVALVLGRKASLILHRHLKEFIDIFGKMFKDDLPNWRGQLNPFKNAGLIVDEVLNTSIILPHQLSYDSSSVKDLKSPHARDVLKVAHSCCEETEREFLFIATLLEEASERTNKDTAEIFMGIKELRDKKILIPIEISAIEAQPVSQQEINLINQKVTSLTNLSNEEKQNLVNFLAQLGPIEREAYLSSLTKQHEIVSAPIKTTIGTIIVDNKKSAKKGVKELSKRAKIAKGKNNYQKTIELYQSAAMLASNWELSNEFVQIEDIIRKTKIEDLSVKKKDLEKEAKDAIKRKDYAEASAKYKQASKIASEIFKLGASDMTKEVKRLTKKANEYEKLK